MCRPSVRAHGDPPRQLLPRFGSRLEERFGSGTMRIPARVAMLVVAKEQRAGNERNEPAHFLLDERHRLRDAETRAECLRDLVERLRFAMGAGNVLQGEFARRRRRLFSYRTGGMKTDGQ